MRYQSTITAGSLKVPESRIIADLLLRGIEGKEWDAAILDENVLQARNRETVRILARLIRSRLNLMDAELWRLVRDGIGDTSTHAVMAAAVKQSKLLGDFLDLAVREQHRIFAKNLTNQLWETFLDDCRSRDPEMPIWMESTRNRLRSSVFQILAQAGYIDNTKSKKLQAVHIDPQVIDYLEKNNEQYVLRCMQVTK